MLDSSELFEAVGGAKLPEPDQDIIQRFRIDEEFAVPIQLTDLELWSNYVNEDLYLMDVKFREFFSRIRWKQQRKGGYKTTASVVFSWIYGRTPTPHDGYACRMIHKLLKYYCTSYTGRTTFNGKAVDRVYKFSRYATINKRPYSLKLRLEMMENGRWKDPWRDGPESRKDKRQHGRRANSAHGEHEDG